MPLLWLLAVSLVHADDYTYTTNNGAVTITGYSGSGGAVTLPGTVNGLPVTSIGESAFAYSVLTSVTIPESVTSLGKSAFAYSALTNVAIPSSVTTIGLGAFYGCTKLTSVAIPSNVASIGPSAFSGCSSLTAITVDGLNAAYSSIDGVLLNQSQTTLLQFPGGKTGDYMVPTTVTSIGDTAFSGCSGLTNITMGSSVSSLGDSAFSYSGLTSATLGSSVTTVGPYAFYQCFSLSSITLPGSVTSVGNAAFALSGLTNVTLPDSLTGIGPSAFAYCGLTSVTLPGSVTNIGDSAFLGCSRLTAITVDALNSAYCSVDGVLLNQSRTTLIQYPGDRAGDYTIPSTVTNIGPSAFYLCSKLTGVTIPDNVTSIGRGAFSYCPKLTGVTIPDSVASIGESAFSYSGLTSVTIGHGLRDIGNYAFYWCSGLAEVYFEGNPPSLGASVFEADNSATVYYLPEATGWTSTFGGRPTVLWNPQVQTGDSSFGVKANQFGFNVTGTSGLRVVVEACTNLVNPVWTRVQTNTITSGTFHFSDPQWSEYPTRLYRLRWP